jgi:hypothetical protein
MLQFDFPDVGTQVGTQLERPEGALRRLSDRGVIKALAWR